MVYDPNSGSREDDEIFYDTSQGQGVFVPREVFEQIVKFAPRFCTDVAILNVDIDQLELAQIASQYYEKILRWQFLLRDDSLPIATIVAQIKQVPPMWEILKNITQLLGIRSHRPAQFFTWKPGGGLRKGETLYEAVMRHASKEVTGLDGHSYHQVHLFNLHFSDSDVEGVSTHTPASAVYITFSLTDRKRHLKFDHGELENKRWHSADEILEGEYDVYTKSVLLLSIFDILLRLLAGIYN
jgi:ADP-ribose pyrophosphatase YjhB (NUDIX family)